MFKFDASICSIVGDVVRVVNPDYTVVEIPFKLVKAEPDQPQFVLSPKDGTATKDVCSASLFMGTWVGRRLASQIEADLLARTVGKALDDAYPFGYRSEDKEA